MKYSKDALLYITSSCFERASFYGVRAILVLFMVGETMKMTTEEALAVYGIFITSLYGSKIIGALFGDLLFGNKRALLVGGLLQTIACFMLCFSSLTLFYIGIGLFVLGNGFFTSNIVAQFGKQFTYKPKLIDSAFTAFFLFVNVGAFLGITFLGSIAEINFKYGFALGGIITLIATIIAYFPKELEYEANKVEFKTHIGLRALFIFIAIILSGIFWMVYELSFFGVYEIQESIIEKSYLTNYRELIMNMLNSYFGIAIAIILTVIWMFIYTNQFFKFFMGLIISAIAFMLLLIMPENNLPILLIFMFLLALGEMFVSPMLYAITTRYSNAKYLAIVLSVVSIPLMLFNKVSGKISEYLTDLGSERILIGSTIVLFFFSLIALTFWLIQKHSQKVQ
ncbi:MFS transporter [Meridianimaribacter flavus]|uniref:Peptide MFS transporter n=1 Tax=Meridianimaribacter flavus TaxID=571115 RepID=A0ABY2G7C8_9FLAO|nr:MFS transporter [Meridianimaribacter flavus]TDY13682.1 hypothetical protein A8975_0275 [Meridianimaribacter flavus]